jgi:hypothetical protein
MSFGELHFDKMYIQTFSKLIKLTVHGGQYRRMFFAEKSSILGIFGNNGTFGDIETEIKIFVENENAWALKITL